MYASRRHYRIASECRAGHVAPLPWSQRSDTTKPTRVRPLSGSASAPTTISVRANVPGVACSLGMIVDGPQLAHVPGSWGLQETPRALGRQRWLCSHGSMWMPANRSDTHGRVARARSRENWFEASSVRLQETANGFASIPARASQLVSELALGPRRFTADIPIGEQGEGLCVREREATHEPAADPKRVEIAVLPGSGSRERGQVPPRAFHPIESHRDAPTHSNRHCCRRRDDGRREVIGRVDTHGIAVLDRHEKWPHVLRLVVEEARKTGGLRAGRGRHV